MNAHQTNVAGIVLAGTYRWGSSPFGRLLRGPLLPIAEQPLISYPLRWLAEGGVSRTVVCANSSTGAVRSRLRGGAELGMQLTYHEDHIPRGAAGCVYDAAISTGHDTFVVVEGGLIPSVDLPALLAAHRASGDIATVVVEMERRYNAVVGERPATPGGIYVFDRRVLESIPELGFQDIKESLLERLYRAGERVGTFVVSGVAPRVISYESFVAVNAWVLSRMVNGEHTPQGHHPVGEGLRHHSALVDTRATIVGPVLIGPEARVKADAVLVGPTIIGAGNVVGRGAMVARSILWASCRIGDAAHVDRCLLTHGMSVPAEAMIENAIRMANESGHALEVAVPELDPPRSMTEMLTLAPGHS
jgi:mannose-1-phosphate guanylyltransferase